MCSADTAELAKEPLERCSAWLRPSSSASLGVTPVPVPARSLNSFPRKRISLSARYRRGYPIFSRRAASTSSALARFREHRLAQPTPVARLEGTSLAWALRAPPHPPQAGPIGPFRYS